MNGSELLQLLPLPQHHTGKEIIVESSTTVDSMHEKDILLSRALARLKDVNSWHRIMDQNFAVFQLTDKAGQPLEAIEPEEGMHFRIDIAGPASESGNGYDWVEIVQAHTFEINAYKGYFITVRPADNPGSKDDHTAHFYTRSSTSTFLVYGHDCAVHAMVLDRNIEVNTDSKTGIDSIRNTVYGAVGKAVFSKIQWQLLADALVQPQPGKV